MIEISIALLTLLIEGLVVSVAGLLIWTVISLKKRSRDRKAASTLVEQIKHQSQTRLEATGSFLSEKYSFEGDELKKAVAAIDKAEKKFMQTMLQIYLKRDAERFESIDASLAELIDTYKSLTPLVPQAASEEIMQELETLRSSNDHLKEELSITKETMSNMISEFGNMFGGGHEHELAKHEVVERVVKKDGEITQPQPAVASEQTVEPESSLEGAEADDDGIILSDTSLDEALDGELPDEPDVEVLTDEGVDELLNGIDLADDAK